MKRSYLNKLIRSKLNLKILIAVLITIVMASSCIPVSAASKSGNYTKPANIWLGDGWEYRLGDSPLNSDGIPSWTTSKDDNWKPYRLNAKVPGAETAQYIWFKIKLPEADCTSPVLKCWYFGKRLDAYMNGKHIYSQNYLDYSGLRRIDYNEYSGDSFELPVKFQTKTLYIRIKTKASFGRINTWSGANIVQYTTPNYYPGIDLFIFGIILVFVSILLFIVFLFIKIDVKIFLAFSLISLTCGIDLLSVTFTKLILNAPTFWYYAAQVSAYLMPVGIFLFFLQSIPQKHKKIISILWKVFAVHAFAMFILDVSGLLPMDYTVFVFYVAFAVATIILLFLLIKCMNESGKESRLILLGATVFGFTGFFDLMHGILGISGQYHPIYPWGLFLFIITLILSMILRYNEVYKKSVDYASDLQVKNRFLKEAWDEIKTSHDEVEELNKTLEQKVIKRTEQLEEANYELEAANIELTALNEELTAMNEELMATMEALNDAQLQLIQSEKIAALGKLVAGVAHELNTPVAIIKSNIQFEETLFNMIDKKEKDSMVSYFEAISPLRDVNKQASERITSIVRSLTNFSRLDESDIKEVDLIEGLDSTVSLLSEQFNSKNISIKKNLSNIPRITCYPKLLNQVFLNLLENSIDAIGAVGIGKITINTKLEGNSIFIDFIDNGVGISSENIQKIFDPGYTTKGVKVGTGLGLAICYRIIEKHNGRITVESTPGKGSKFTIVLPVERQV